MSSQDDQVLSIRLRRKNTGTPWGFRMHGGAEYTNPIFIQHVNPKSLAYRHGLRVKDRLLAVGNTPTHNLTHEQVKMEIIRAGNELDFVVQRNMAAAAAAGLDQQDSRPVRQVQQPSYPEQPDEEPSDYRSGYTNPKVQSRSFKILQESLNYTEADEEGIVVPSGHTPGEGVVLRAYNEGKRRMQELAEISPRNFSTESPIYERGQNLLKCSDEEEAIIAKLKCSYKSGEPQVASSRSFTPGGGGGGGEAQRSQAVDLAGSSCLAPVAAQQKYLQQAHAYYGNDNAPTIQTVVHQPVQSAKSAVHQAVHAETQAARAQRQQQMVPTQTHQPVTVQTQHVQQAQRQPHVQVQSQQAVQVQQVQGQQHIQMQAQQAETQQAPRRRERKRPDRQQQAVTQSIQSPVAVTQSSGFIPHTDTVSSVAEDLNLRYTGKRDDAAVPHRSAATTHVAVQSVQNANMSQVVPQTHAQQTIQTNQVPAKPVADAQSSQRPEVSAKVQVVGNVEAKTSSVTTTADVSTKQNVQIEQTTIKQSTIETVQTSQTVSKTPSQQTIETQPTPKEETPSQVKTETVEASPTAAPKPMEKPLASDQTAQNDSQMSQSTKQPTAQQNVQAEEIVTKAIAEAQQELKQEVSEGIQADQTEVQLVTVSSAESTTEVVNTAADTVDATVEPSGDVIREYGERMAETVISQSLQDASQNKKDAIDGSCISKDKSLTETVEQKQEPLPEVLEKKPEPEPEVKVLEQETKADDGKSGMKPTVESSETVVVSGQMPAEQVVKIETSKTDIVPEKPAAGEVVNLETSSNTAAVEETSSLVVNVESSQNEVVVESISVPEENATVTIDTASKEGVSKSDNISVGMTTTETKVFKSTSNSEKAELSVTAGEQAIVTEGQDGGAIELTISEGVSAEENVQISIGEEEASFTIGGEEESSFVLEVQEEGTDVSADVQESSFEISIGEDTDETANITLDLSTDVTVDAAESNSDENAQVSFSIQSNDVIETVIAEESPKTEPKEEPKKTESKAAEPKGDKNGAKTDNKTDYKNTGPVKKVKIVDSQGGVAARMARFNLKKK